VCDRVSTSLRFDSAWSRSWNAASLALRSVTSCCTATKFATRPALSAIGVTEICAFTGAVSALAKAHGADRFRISIPCHTLSYQMAHAGPFALCSSLAVQDLRPCLREQKCEVMEAALHPTQKY